MSAVARAVGVVFSSALPASGSVFGAAASFGVKTSLSRAICSASKSFRASLVTGLTVPVTGLSESVTDFDTAAAALLIWLLI